LIATHCVTLDGLVEKITTPLLITDPGGEQFFPSQSHEFDNRLPATSRSSGSPGNRTPTPTASRWLARRSASR
jgi:hypothetical protein